MSTASTSAVMPGVLLSELRCAGESAPNITVLLSRGSVALVSGQCGLTQWPGKLVLERYFEGPDDRRSIPLGKVAFDATTLHDVRSVSKSLVGLLYFRNCIDLLST